MTYFLEGELSAKECDPDAAKFRVIPVPLERTVSYGAGTGGGPQAILAASVELERLYLDTEPCAMGIFTEPEVNCSGPLPDVMERIAHRCEAALSRGTTPVVLGGEHALSYGAIRGISRAIGQKVGVIQIDAHADLRKAYQGERHSHASVMQLLLEEEGIRLAQLGIRAQCREEIERAAAHNVLTYSAKDLVTGGINRIELPADFPENLYVSFDLDGLDPSILPATGTPVPGGLGYYQALSLIESALSGRRLVGFDVVELAPYTSDGGPGSRVSDFTAAQITYALMSLCQ